MRLIAYGVVTILIAGLIGIAPAASQTNHLHSNRQNGASASVVTLRACNHTHDNLMVAGSYIPVGGGDWLNEGWTSVGPGECQDIFKTDNQIFYARAEVKDNSNTFWGDDIAQCVSYPGPYHFTTKSEDTSCPDGDDAVKFTTFHANGQPVMIWDLS
jgi:uncharacterized membrane protein